MSNENNQTGLRLISGGDANAIASYRVLNRVEFDHERFEPGSLIWLSLEHAQPLLDCKAVEPEVQDPATLSTAQLQARIARKRAERGA